MNKVHFESKHPQQQTKKLQTPPKKTQKQGQGIVLNPTYEQNKSKKVRDSKKAYQYLSSSAKEMNHMCKNPEIYRYKNR